MIFVDILCLEISLLYSCCSMTSCTVMAGNASNTCHRVTRHKQAFIKTLVMTLKVSLERKLMQTNTCILECLANSPTPLSCLVEDFSQTRPRETQIHGNSSNDRVGGVRLKSNSIHANRSSQR